MFSFKNPYNEAKAELLRQYKGELPSDKQEEYDELERKSRELVAEKMWEAEQQVVRIHEKANETPKNYPKPTKQYKELVKLHREAKEITKEIGLMKKSVREEIENRKKKDKEAQKVL